MMQDGTTQAAPKKIAIIGLGGVGEETLKQARLLYPDAEIVAIAKDSTLEKKGCYKETLSEIENTYPALKNSKGSVTFTSDFLALKDCEYAMVSGGPKRKAGEQRENLLSRSKDFLDWVADGVNTAKDNGLDISSITWFFNTNPIDTLAQYAVEKMGIDPTRVSGPLGGELDKSRLERAVCDRLNEYYKDTEGFKPLKPRDVKYAGVEGEHGKNNMVVVTSNIVVNINGEEKKLAELKGADGAKVIDSEVNATLATSKTALADPNNPRKLSMLDAIIEDTIEGGTIITLQTGASDPGSSAMINARVLQNVVNARAGKDSEPFYASALVPNEGGIFLSQRIQAQQDGTFKVVEKTQGIDSFDEKEQAAWDAAIDGQKTRYENLGNDINTAKENDIKAQKAEEAANKARDDANMEEFVKAIGRGHKSLLTRAEVLDNREQRSR